jgi:hypothetical protein
MNGTLISLVTETASPTFGGASTCDDWSVLTWCDGQAVIINGYVHAIHSAIPGSSPTRSAGPRAVINRASRCRPSRNGRRASGRSVYLCTGARGGNCPRLPGRVPQLARSISRIGRIARYEDGRLQRFVAVQDAGGTYDHVAAERRAGRKPLDVVRLPADRRPGIRPGVTDVRDYLAGRGQGLTGPSRFPVRGCATILTGLTGCTAELRSSTFIVIWQLDHKGDPLFLYRSHISPSTIISVLPSSHASHSCLSVNGGTAPDAQVG